MDDFAKAGNRPLFGVPPRIAAEMTGKPVSGDSNTCRPGLRRDDASVDISMFVRIVAHRTARWV